MPFDTQLLPSINAKSLREHGKQYYVDTKGNRFPSVTTILSATKPQAERDHLWRRLTYIASESLRKLHLIS